MNSSLNLAGAEETPPTATATTFLDWMIVGCRLYLAVEVVFYVVFRKFMIPRAQRFEEPSPYRDYGRDRCRLMERIMDRIEESSRDSDIDLKDAFLESLSGWFYPAATATATATAATANNNTDTKGLTTPTNQPNRVPPLSPTPSSSCESLEENSGVPDVTTKNALYKEDMDLLFAWAFFGKHLANLLPWESEEMNLMYRRLRERVGLCFPSKDPAQKDANSRAVPSSNNNNNSNENGCHERKPRLMSLEPVVPMYRPLLVYLLSHGIKSLGDLYLITQGFRRHVASSGLVGWYRLPRNSPQTQSPFLPLLFFHGIAPAGFCVYLPKVLFGLAPERDRPVFIFENPSISCTLGFHALNEDQTVDGVCEMLDKVNLLQSKLSLVGHSFGSCTISWLLGSKRLPNVEQVVLIDPVAILLSEPDVMVNVLYRKTMDTIYVLASSELFTQHYLRRHFAWYNSELWLEDITCKMIVCLSEQDAIINAAKVKQEVEKHASKDQIIYWKQAEHGDCTASPQKWRQVKQMMLQQELEIVKGK